ncbi:MAG TPA: serine hydrolase domain-containing protein [Pyrinomonadaceae bacterium]|jgi:CubicO group peptidase (beta-lactamase class C family)|nr:serine hydrolase domain-containing protein [Pyrinomonadaceae bacterium]
MPTVISRRKLLSTGIKTGLGAVLLREITLNATPATVWAQATERPGDRFRAAYQRLDDYIARHMAEVGVPGMTLAISDRNGLLRSSQYGFADLKAGIKVSPQTLFEIGSISKSFVAMAVLQLAEEGKLDLQKPVTSYLPWLKVESRFSPFTISSHLQKRCGPASSIVWA